MISKQKVKPSIIYYNSQINLRIHDINNHDLLNPHFSNHYTLRDIKVLTGENYTNQCTINKHPDYNFYYLKVSLQLPTIKKTQETYKSITKIRIGPKKYKIKGIFTVSLNREKNNNNLGNGNGYSITLKKAWIHKDLIYDKNLSVIKIPILIIPI